nr:MAG TPA: hypothetical protein [Caudoviricetes sp.]DAL52636.1 MAG TPA_asm: hypothetical protein [Bacteriophage sp.]
MLLQDFPQHSPWFDVENDIIKNIDNEIFI